MFQIDPNSQCDSRPGIVETSTGSGWIPFVYDINKVTQPLVFKCIHCASDLVLSTIASSTEMAMMGRLPVDLVPTLEQLRFTFVDKVPDDIEPDHLDDAACVINKVKGGC